MTELGSNIEIVVDAKESGQATRVTAFEPEILAFCCEH
jgi:hypothetical protein